MRWDLKQPGRARPLSRQAAGGAYGKGCVRQAHRVGGRHEVRMRRCGRRVATLGEGAAHCAAAATRGGRDELRQWHRMRSMQRFWGYRELRARSGGSQSGISCQQCRREAVQAGSCRRRRGSSAEGPVSVSQARSPNWTALEQHQGAEEGVGDSSAVRR